MPTPPRTTSAILLVIIAMLGQSTSVSGQTLDELLDERRFIEGLIDYELDDLLEHVLETTGQGDPATPYLIRIARARSRMVDVTNTRAEQAAALARLLDERRALIEALSNDLRLGTWRLDLAIDLLSLAARQRGLDLVVEFGIAGPDQQSQLHALASEAFEQAELASFDLTDAILDLEDDPAFAGSAELQARRRELADIEQRRRLPYALEHARYLRAIAAPHHSTETDGETDARINTAMDAVLSGLGAIAGELVEPWSTQAQMTMALAQIRLGRGDDAAARLDPILARTDLPSIERIRGEFAVVLMLAREQDARAALSHLDELVDRDLLDRDPFWRLLLADQRCTYRLRVAKDFPGMVPGVDATTGIASAQRLAYRWALDAYTDFAEDEMLPMSRVDRDLIVSERLGRIMPADSSIDSWPPGAVMSLAIRRLTAPDTREAGIALLCELVTEARIGGQPVPDSVRSRAMTALGEALIADGLTHEGITVLIDMASAYPDEPTAPTVAARATHLAHDVYVNTSPDAPGRSVVVDIYDRALSLMVDAFPNGPGIDRWAYERGRFDVANGRIDDAIDAFAAVGPTARFHVDAQFQIASLQWSQLKAETDADDTTRIDPDRLDQVRRSLGTARRRIQEQQDGIAGRERKADFTYYLAATDVMLAETDIAAGDPESAMRRLEGFDQRIIEPVSLLSRAMIARVHAGELLGQTARVDEDLMALARRDPERARPMLGGIVDQLYEDVIADRLPPRMITRERQREDASGRRYLRLAQLNATLYRSASSTDANAIHARLRHAQGLHGVGQHETALDGYRDVNAIEGVTPTLASILGEAECLFVLQRHEDAMRLFRQILGGRSTEGGLAPRVVLLAELRCLQLLDRAQQNTDAIYPRIQRLRRQDRDLGGEDLRAAFSVLEARYLP